MFPLLKLLVSFRKASARFYFFICVIFTVANAQAITINFDDLNPEDFIDAETGELVPLSNQYETHGVIFEHGAYLLSYSTKSLPNYINGPGFGIRFLEMLPTHVSMYVGSTTGYKVGISALGMNGHVKNYVTDGEVHGMNSEDSTPYRPNQFVSFYISEGISYVSFSGQADTYVDDLSFTVPEPAAWMLFAIGGLMLILRRKRY